MINPPSSADSFQSPEASEAIRIIGALRDAGFVAYLAGGCVRDALLGRRPKDYDVATDATPESVRAVFGKARTLAFGASFGVIGVLPEKRPTDTAASVQPTEVATFRSDGTYSDGRRPDSVHFGNARQDALRRDFTINGLFFDPVAAEVIDYVGGQNDLASGVLRTIGDPEHRFGEDKLRMLRAVRFATTLDFQVDQATRDAIRRHADQIDVVSGERVGAEMRRVMVSPGAADGLASLVDCGLADHVFPEISQTPMQRLASVLSALPERTFSAAMACVLVDHPAPRLAVGAITNRWKLSSEEVRQMTAALLNQSLVRAAAETPWSTIQPVLAGRDAPIIVSVAEAVATANQGDLSGVLLSRRALEMPPDELDPPPLVTGADLKSLGIPAGPRYREILERIRREQLDGRLKTTEEALASLGR